MVGFNPFNTDTKNSTLEDIFCLTVARIGSGFIVVYIYCYFSFNPLSDKTRLILNISL